MIRVHTWVVAISCTFACARVSKERGHDDVSRVVRERTGFETAWDRGSPEDRAVAARVDMLLEGGLNKVRAIEIALVNNPSLQSTYEQLGVSRADMVQAGLLSNPVVSGDIGWSTDTRFFEYQASIVQNFLEIFVLRMRKRIAKEQFMADTLRVAHEVLQVVADVSKAFVDLQAHVQTVELMRTVLQAARAAAHLSMRQHEAGNITDLAVATERAAYEQAKFDLAREQLEVTKAREQLNRLLGLWGKTTNWKLSSPLPELPVRDPPLNELEANAIRHRLDIDAARKQALLLDNAVTLARRSRAFGFVNVGVHVHQDPDGARIFGPTLALELPIFDRRQALIARLEAQHRQAERRLTSLSVNARSEVRVARTELLSARQVVDHYMKVLLPLRAAVVEHAQHQYNGMQIGLHELLTAKQAQVQAFEDYIQAVHDYWIAWAELERAMGGRVLPKRGPGKHHHR